MGCVGGHARMGRPARRSPHRTVTLYCIYGRAHKTRRGRIGPCQFVGPVMQIRSRLGQLKIRIAIVIILFCVLGLFPSGGRRRSAVQRLTDKAQAEERNGLRSAAFRVGGGLTKEVCSLTRSAKTSSEESARQLLFTLLLRSIDLSAN